MDNKINNETQVETLKTEKSEALLIFKRVVMIGWGAIACLTWLGGLLGFVALPVLFGIAVWALLTEKALRRWVQFVVSGMWLANIGLFAYFCAAFSVGMDVIDRGERAPLWTNFTGHAVLAIGIISVASCVLLLVALFGRRLRNPVKRGKTGQPAPAA